MIKDQRQSAPAASIVGASAASANSIGVAGLVGTILTVDGRRVAVGGLPGSQFGAALGSNSDTPLPFCFETVRGAALRTIGTAPKLTAEAEVLQL